MASNVRIKLNSAGVRSILKGGPMQGLLRGYAQGIAGRAGPGHEVHVGTTGTRARAEVVTSTFDAMRAEAVDRNLSRAIGR